MGVCHHTGESDSLSKISKSEFTFLKQIGRGGLGKVWHVYHKPSKTDLALKVYLKSEIPSKDALNSILKERSLLSILSHPFIINLVLAFQDSKTLYLGLDLKLGGDFRFHMLQRKFSEPETKFILFCILQALAYLHSQGIIHKDLKPENIILDSAGYAFLTDFGTSCVCRDDNYEETAGTPGYIAPEVICRQNHGYVSDFFGLGVILFEIITGKRPYRGKGRKEIREAILQKQAKIEMESVQGWSAEAVDLCNRLLKRKPERRIGFGGIEEVKGHQWFRGLDEEALKRFEVKAPFVPKNSDNFDQEYVRRRNKVVVKEKFGDGEFLGYFFVPNLKVIY